MLFRSTFDLYVKIILSQNLQKSICFKVNIHQRCRELVFAADMPVGVALRLGVKMVLDLVYAVEIPKAFKKLRGFDHMSFWKHSFAVGFLSRTLSMKFLKDKEDREISYLAGLLHDMGILVFHHLLEKEYRDFLERIETDPRPLQELEEKQFGIGHAELGACFIERWWPVSDLLVRGVRGHHAGLPSSGFPEDLVQLVAIANALANSNGILNGVVHPLPPAVSSETWMRRLEFSPDDYEILTGKIEELVQTTEMLLD